jgi:hypothetical protein
MWQHQSSLEDIRIAVDPTVTNFVIVSRAAENLHKPAETLPGWLELAKSVRAPDR